MELVNVSPGFGGVLFALHPAATNKAAAGIRGRKQLAILSIVTILYALSPSVDMTIFSFAFIISSHVASPCL